MNLFHLCSQLHLICKFGETPTSEGIIKAENCVVSPILSYRIGATATTTITASAESSASVPTVEASSTSAACADAADALTTQALSQTYVIEPELWNAVDQLIGGRDEVAGHDKSEALTERRPVVIAPDRPRNAPLAFASDQLLAPGVAQQ